MCRLFQHLVTEVTGPTQTVPGLRVVRRVDDPSSPLVKGGSKTTEAVRYGFRMIYIYHIIVFNGTSYPMHIIYRSANKYPEIPGLTPWVDCPGANSHSHRHCQCHLGGIGLLGEDDEQKALISTAKVGEKRLRKPW